MAQQAARARRFRLQRRFVSRRRAPLSARTRSITPAVRPAGTSVSSARKAPRSASSCRYFSRQSGQAARCAWARSRSSGVASPSSIRWRSGS